MLKRVNNTLGSCLIAGAMLASGSAQADLIANFHKNLSGGNNSLFIFGAENTSGTISGNDGFSAPFTIDSTGVFEFLVGVSGREMSANGAVNDLSLLVSSADPISGIALNRASATTDQTNLLDTNALGTEYIAMAFGGVFGNGSQMSVTATEDNTVVTITSPIALAGNPANTPFNVTLNKGESVFYTSGVRGDLTGTKVSSDKDVAVFAGAECTQVPNGLIACDHIISQQYSVDNFGTEFNISENFGGGANGDLVRILAAEDGTQVFLNGALVATLNAGEFFDIDNVGNGKITSSKPVTVGQYIRGQGGTRTTGDPAFTIIPATNQYLDDYVFSTPVGNDTFSQNFLNVAINAVDAASLMLNGSLVDTSLFTNIGGTLFGNIGVAAGVGNIKADNPFLATSAGFSSFDSYFNTIATTFSAGASPPPPPPPPPRNDVPEPGTLAVLALGLLGLGARRARKA